MDNFKNIDEILEFAITNEIRAAEFYENLSTQAKSKSMKETFEKFSKEERGHEARLKKIKSDGVFEARKEDILDMKMSDYLVKSNTKGKMTYQDALILAMKREKAAYKLYKRLAKSAPTKELKKIFTKLAGEEANHKMNFEIEYDDYIYIDN
ncbi:MAG: ferritin family protein [Flavobacteriaceae bacterium]|nr:ferritin family protein [Flavobacteriaceae bacterium]